MSFTNREYYEYLQSGHWYNLRSRLMPDGTMCFGCKKRRASHLHHCTYKRPYHELDADLIPMCKICHNTLHAYLKKQYPGRTVNSMVGRTYVVWKYLFGHTDIPDDPNPKPVKLRKKARSPKICTKCHRKIPWLQKSYKGLCWNCKRLDKSDRKKYSVV